MKAFKLLLVALVVNFYTSTWSQLSCYQVFYDSIDQVAEQDYLKAKKNYFSFGRQCKWDPINSYFFLEKVLETNDFKTYRRVVNELIIEYGFTYTTFDTLMENRIDVVKDLIYTKKLSEWTIKKSKRNHPKWLRDHPNNSIYLAAMKEIHTRDQLVRRMASYTYWNLDKFKDQLDTTIIAELLELEEEIADKVDLENVIKFQTLCVRNNYRLPTNFDACWNITGLTSFVLFHNFKERTNAEEVFHRLYPYIERAYLDGKIPPHALELFDSYLYDIYGLQYYGSKGNEVQYTDAFNSDHVLEIREKFLDLQK